MRRIHRNLFAGVMALAAGAWAHAAPDHVDITWLSITNMHFAAGEQRILADGYITRLPEELFHRGANGVASTRRGARSDLAAVTEVFDAIGGKSAINLLLTGHSHFDHSFDTGSWAQLSGARVMGSPTTCLQVRAVKIPKKRCTPVFGGEKFTLEPGFDMYVIRWNHSGDPAKNPEQHNPVELRDVPVPEADGFRAGVAEDFPNGGGNRAYLFKVAGPHGTFSWLFQDSGSPVDLSDSIIIDGRNHGAPLENLRAALKAADLDAVDLWIATGGRELATLVLPVLRPKAYLPVHWDGLYGAFKAGPSQPYSDPDLAKLLEEQGVRLIVPAQYMDRWRLDHEGVRVLDNSAIKQKLGFQ